MPEKATTAIPKILNGHIEMLVPTDLFHVSRRKDGRVGGRVQAQDDCVPFPGVRPRGRVPNFNSFHVPYGCPCRQRVDYRCLPATTSSSPWVVWKFPWEVLLNGSRVWSPKVFPDIRAASGVPNFCSLSSTVAIAEH
jgi:hypothetical protein